MECDRGLKYLLTGLSVWAFYTKFFQTAKKSYVELTRRFCSRTVQHRHSDGSLSMCIVSVNIIVYLKSNKHTSVSKTRYTIRDPAWQVRIFKCFCSTNKMWWIVKQTDLLSRWVKRATRSWWRKIFTFGLQQTSPQIYIKLFVVFTTFLFLRWIRSHDIPSPFGNERADHYPTQTPS